IVMAATINIEQLALDFINTLKNRKTADELLPFYHQQVQQTEYANNLVKTTVTRTLEDLKVAAQKGQTVLQKEEYDIVNSYTIGNTVILEAIWTGTLAIPIGSIPAGGKMTAHFAQFYEFENGKIIRQRNYDCFDPF